MGQSSPRARLLPAREPFPCRRTRLPPPSQDEARFCASPLAFVISSRLPRGPQEEANSILNAGNSQKGVQSYELKCWGFTFHTVFSAKPVPPNPASSQLNSPHLDNTHLL